MALRYGLEGRVVLVTGAAGGIGRWLAQAFADQGAQLVLVDRDTTRLAAFGKTLHSSSGALTLTCDLGDDTAVAELVSKVAARFDRLDVLVNNAGSEYPTPMADDAPQAMLRWSALLDNNVTSMVRLTRALLPMMDGNSCIINQSSIWGHTGVADFSAYVASKHAVIGLTRSLAWELAPRGIRVNAVCPGWIRTDAAMASLQAMAAAQGQSAAQIEAEILSRQALPGMLSPPDIAGIFLFLASADARSLTGQSIAASNGEVML